MVLKQKERESSYLFYLYSKRRTAEYGTEARICEISLLADIGGGGGGGGGA